MRALMDSYGLELFLSTPSARRATVRQQPDRLRRYISIHALREEGDLGHRDRSGARYRFLSTPSARRATSPYRPRRALRTNFYPRPPRGGRLVEVEACNAAAVISIHALREEGDPTVSTDGAAIGEFLSTPSARRATYSGES